MANLYFLGNTTRIQMFGCVVLSNNKTIVIDGGTSDDGLQLYTLLKEKARSCVDAWFFTHPHHDHIGAFLKICKSHPDINISEVLFNFPSSDLLDKYGKRSDHENIVWHEFENVINHRFSQNFKRIDSGDVFEFDNIKVNVLRVFNDKIISDYINNSSAVLRIDSPSKRVLILGDLGVEGGQEVMSNLCAESLHADYTQMAHHGQNGVNKEFYQYIKPEACLWASPDWLWDNDNGNGFDSGQWHTVETRKWMSELGVEKHYVAKDGTTEIML